MSRCGMCGAVLPASAKFCPECGERLEPVKAEQRKLATILFCDVVGSTAMGETLDPESVREVMLQFFGVVRQVIEAHGGITQKFIGDAVMAVFGVPVASEHDALRSVMAAVEVQERLAALNEQLQATYGVELAVRMGINSGTVVVGDARRDDALVLGDPVNVAARIEQSAPSGEVLIGEATHRLVRESVEAEPMTPISVKGKREPLAVYRLAGLRTERRRARLDSVAMVGREEPLAALLAALDQIIREDEHRLLVVVGEAGMGKTRLVNEFEARAEAAFLHGRCLAYGEGVTYWPLGEIVREASGILEEDSVETALRRLSDHPIDPTEGPRVVAYLGQALGLSGGEAEPADIAWAARRFLDARARTGPIVVCVDDLHWAEPRLLDLLERLVNPSSGAPVLVVGMARPEFLSVRPDWPAIHLEQLSEEHTDTLVSRLVDLDDATRSQLVQRAGGSPLFVEELVVAVIEEPDRDLPTNVEALLNARLDRFSRAERFVLESGAVEGLVFHRGAVERLIADKHDVDLDETLRRLTESGVIALEPQRMGDDLNYRFRHILIRDAVYEGIPKRVRAHLHELLVEWGTDNHGDRVSEYEELLAYHLGRAYECRAELGVTDAHTRQLARSASERLRASARRAVARADPLAAVGQLTRAVAMLESDQDLRLELLPELGEAHRLSGDPVSARAVLREAIDRGVAAGNITVTTTARVEEALLRLTSDPEVEADEVAAVADEAIAMFEATGDQMRLAKAWALVGDNEWHCCRAAPMEAAFLNALECLAHTDAPAHPAWILRLLALCYYTGPAPVDVAIERCHGLIDHAQGNAATEVAIWASVGALEAMRGNFDAARDIFDRCRSIGEEFSLGPTLAALPVLTGPVETLAGDLDAAVSELLAGCAALEAYGQRSVLSTAAAFLARALERQDQLVAADEWAATSERTASKDDTSSQILWRGVRARLLARSGQHDRARKLAQDGVAIAARTDFLVLRGEALVDLAVVLTAESNEPGAAEALASARELFAAKGHSVLVEQTEPTIAG